MGLSNFLAVLLFGIYKLKNILHHLRTSKLFFLQCLEINWIPISGQLHRKTAKGKTNFGFDGVENVCASLVDICLSLNAKVKIGWNWFKNFLYGLPLNSFHLILVRWKLNFAKYIHRWDKMHTTASSSSSCVFGRLLVRSLDLFN